MRGQCYDGAGNMAGKTKGVGARIQAQFPQALPFWCVSHQLNRCVVQACTIPDVRNMMSEADEMVKFFEWSPAKQNVLERHIEEMFTEKKKTKLKQLCRTRWVERHDSLKTFIELLPAIVESLEDFTQLPNTRKPGVASASSLLKTATEFSFLVTIVIVQRCLAYLSGLTRSLQERGLDVGKAFQQVSAVQEALQDTRNNVEGFHRELFSDATHLAELLNVEPSKPRTCGRQRNRNNIPSESVEEYFRKAVTIPFLDHLLNEMSTRFTPLLEHTTLGLKLVPAFVESKPRSDDFDFFLDDLPYADCFDAELHQYYLLWRGKEQKPATIAAALQECNGLTFPNIHRVLQLCATFPITSCECERSISVLRLLKTYLRATMGQDRMSALALMYVHRDLSVDTRDVVKEFARKQPRKILLPNLFNEV